MNNETKKGTLLDFDKVLGLGLQHVKQEELEIPAEILALATERQKARASKEWTRADELRDEINKMGFIIKDKNNSFEIIKK